MDIFILLGIYFVFSPIIFFLLTKSKIKSLGLKIENLEREIRILKASKESKIKNEKTYDGFDVKIIEKEDINFKEDNFAYKEANSTKKETKNRIFDEKKQSSFEKTGIKKTEAFAFSKISNKFIKNEDNVDIHSFKERKSLKDVFNFEFKLEAIIGKLGALLLLIGLAFVYKYAYDNGYISKGFTIALGYFISLFIFLCGQYFIKKDRIILAQILIGTAFAFSYITTYSGYLYYQILSDFIAFLILVFISSLIFLVSYFNNFQTVITLASVSSISVPFLVNIEFLGILGFGLYLIVLSLISLFIYSLKKWHILQVSTVATSLISLFVIVVIDNKVTDLLFLNILIIIESLIIILQDVIVYLFDDEDFKMLKSSIIQAFSSVFCVFLILYTEYFSQKNLAYIMFVYSLVFAVSTYFLYQKHSFVHFVKTTYTLATISIILALSLLFADFYFAMFILAVSAILIIFDNFIKHRLSFLLASTTHLLSMIIIVTNSLHNEKFINMLILFVLSMFLIILSYKFVREEFKEKMSLVSLQIYPSVFLNYCLFVLNPNEINFKLFAIIFSEFLALNTVLFLVSELIDYKFKIFSKKYQSIILLCMLAIDLVKFNTFISGGYNNEFNIFVGFACVILISLSILSILLISKNYKDSSKRFYSNLISLIFSQIMSLIYFNLIFDDFRYGLVFSSLFLVAFELAFKKFPVYFESKRNLKLLKYAKLLSLVFNAIFYIVVYPELYFEKTFNLQMALLNSLNLKIFLHNLKIFKLNDYIIYILSSLVVIYVSYIHIYIPTNGNHYVSLIWATYVIIMFVYYIKKADIKMVNASLFSLILIVAKFVIIDLKTASIISKVLTSLIFGVVLLTLSYLMPKLIKNYSSEKNESDV